MKKINIFSSFDGYGGQRIISDRLGMNVGYYYTSEIDKNAIKIRRKNYPNCVELGDITQVDVFDLDELDLFTMGFPCVDLSPQGRRAGMSTVEKVEVTSLEQYLELKGSDFKFIGQSWLFWEGVRCLRDAQAVNPDIKFLIENVSKMPKKWADVITKVLGVDPIVLCGGDVSPALRPRMYWCNWEVTPIEKESMPSAIKDIMVSECESFEHIYMGKERFDGLVPAGGKRGGKANPLFHKPSRRQGYQVFDTNYKLECIDTCAGGGRTPFLMLDNGKVRYAHPVELERCVGLDDDYTAGLKPGPRKKMIGNGWNLLVVGHIEQCLLNTGWMQNCD